VGQQPHDGQGQGAFASAALPHDAVDLPLFLEQAYAVKGVDVAGRTLELDVQILDFKNDTLPGLSRITGVSGTGGRSQVHRPVVAAPKVEDQVVHGLDTAGELRSGGTELLDPVGVAAGGYSGVQTVAKVQGESILGLRSPSVEALDCLAHPEKAVVPGPFQHFIAGPGTLGRAGQEPPPVGVRCNDCPTPPGHPFAQEFGPVHSELILVQSENQGVTGVSVDLAARENQEAVPRGQLPYFIAAPKGVVFGKAHTVDTRSLGALD
jgi:hypothetical protein